jgi:hypothetical protein
MNDDLFYVWTEDDIDSSSFEDTNEPRTLYVCYLCRDTEGTPDIIRGYDPHDGIFERPGAIVAALGGIDADDDDYRREVERELLSEFEAQREAAIVRGDN